jgi:hypothetical protein
LACRPDDRAARRRGAGGLLDIVSDAVADVRAAAERRGLRIVEQGIAGQVLWADPH